MIAGRHFVPLGILCLYINLSMVWLIFLNTLEEPLMLLMVDPPQRHCKSYQFNFIQHRTLFRKV